MKQKMVIFVEIDTDTPNLKSVSTTLPVKDEKDYVSTVARNLGLDYLAAVHIGSDTKGYSASSVLAHELGHVVAGFLQMPFAKTLGATGSKARVGEELEAWNVARDMGIPIDERTVNKGLHGHKERGEFEDLIQTLSLNGLAGMYMDEFKKQGAT